MYWLATKMSYDPHVIRIPCTAQKQRLLSEEARKLSSYRNTVFIPSNASYDFVNQKQPPGVAFFIFAKIGDALFFKLSFSGLE